MKQSSCTRDGVAALACLPALLTLAGCASPGQPRPPSLHIARPVKDLRAERVGPAVHLSWNTPADSTDGQGIRGVLQAVLCREPASQPATEKCHRVGSANAVPGPSTADDVLPAALQTGPPVALRYRVQLLNAQGRSAAPSNPAYALAGQAPAPVGPLTATLARGGVLLRWTPAPTTPGTRVEVELQRVLVAAAPRASAGGSALPAPAPLPGSKHPAVPVLLRAQPATPAAGAPAPHDAGGLLDPGVRPGDRYRYVAQRIESVTVPERSGPLTLELRGEPSPAVEVTFQETFPPHVPTGLVAFANPGDPGSTPPVPASVDLSWDGSVEPNLLGYFVYRSEGGGFHRLQPAPVSGPAFHDGTVAPGQTLRYRVTAVDRAGNESGPSATVLTAIPQP